MLIVMEIFFKYMPKNYYYSFLILLYLSLAFLLTRSRRSLSSADESMLQAIVESLLPLRYRIPELTLIMDGKKIKYDDCFGFSDIFVLKGTGDNYINLELKYVALVGLMKDHKATLSANELENLDKSLEKENEDRIYLGLLDWSIYPMFLMVYKFTQIWPGGQIFSHYCYEVRYITSTLT
jgi:hypothetical protein